PDPAPVTIAVFPAKQGMNPHFLPLSCCVPPITADSGCRRHPENGWAGGYLGCRPRRLCEIRPFLIHARIYLSVRYLSTTSHSRCASATGGSRANFREGSRQVAASRACRMPVGNIRILPNPHIRPSYDRDQLL